MFKHLLKVLIVLPLLALSSMQVIAQEIPIRGRILDLSTDEPLIGVVIREEGGKVLGSTDSEGRFDIKSSLNQKVLVSYIGYEPTSFIVTRSREPLTIRMATSENSLSEVVITGALGIKRNARELGVSTSQISSKTLNQAAVVNPLNGLQGKVAGLQVNLFDSGVNPQVRVTLRGARNISDGNNEPLVVIDGVPMPSVDYFNPQLAASTRSASAISLVNPNDIEDIVVLKGANASAIYGSQGVNGVLLITTKKGAQGKGRISYSNSTTFDKIAWLPELQTQYGSGVNGVFSGNTHESWGPAYDGNLVKVGPVLPDGTQWELPYQAIKNRNENFFDTGVTQQNSLNFSGGDANSTYFISGQHVHTKGTLPKDWNEKINFRANASRKFGKLLSSFNVNYVRTITNTTSSEPWNNVRNMPLYIDLEQLKDWRNDYKAMPEYYFSGATINPYWGIDNQRSERKQNNLNGNLNFEYEFAPWLKAIYRVGLSSTQSDVRATTAKISYPDVYDQNGNKLVRPSAANGSVNDAMISNDQFNSDLILQANTTFGNFSLKGILGHNFQDIKSKSFNLASSAINVSGTYNQSNRTGNLSGASYLSHWRREGTYAEATLGYKNYLFGTLNGRFETVSLLSKDNRSYFYPGANISFVASDALDFIKESSTVSFLKLFASASKTANVTISPYQLNNTFSLASGFPYGNLYGTTLSTTNNNGNISPEFVYSVEGGFNIGFLKDRLRLEAVYAYADSRDQILSVATSYATGFATTFTNAARMKSKSLELSLNGDIIRQNNVSWSMGVNYTNNNNTGVSLFGDLPSLNQWKGLYLVPGGRYPTYLMPDYVRDPEGRVVVDKTTGRPSISSTLKNMGTSQPIHILGVNTNVRYKQVSLQAVIDARWGNKYYTAAAENEITAGLAPRTVEYDREDFIFPNSVIEVEPGVYQENTSVYIQGGGLKAYWNGLDRSVLANNVFDAMFIKLREVNLTYELPSSLLAKQKLVQGISVSLIGRNLINIRAKDNIYGETEYIYLSGVGFSGWRTLPAQRTYGFNINVNF